MEKIQFFCNYHPISVESGKIIKGNFNFFKFCGRATGETAEPIEPKFLRRTSNDLK
jgi:hypothetical protein